MWFEIKRNILEKDGLNFSFKKRVLILFTFKLKKEKVQQNYIHTHLDT